jgi:predicted nucleotidyltransferase
MATHEMPMVKREAIVQLVHRWCQDRPVALCVLFGSQATGKLHQKSDIDLAVWPSEPILPLMKLSWLRELETSLGQPVSLVLVSSDLDPVLGLEISRHGLPLFEAEPGLWSERRAQLWHAYNDSLPFRRAERQRLREYAEGLRRDE